MQYLKDYGFKPYTKIPEMVQAVMLDIETTEGIKKLNAPMNSTLCILLPTWPKRSLRKEIKYVEKDNGYEIHTVGGIIRMGVNDLDVNGSLSYDTKSVSNFKPGDFDTPPLIALVLKSGIDNIEEYDALILRPDSNFVHIPKYNYKSLPIFVIRNEYISGIIKR